MKFRVVDVSAHAPVAVEPLGTKYKFWYVDQDYHLTLFKEGRPGTGENWAEKLACVYADSLKLPHANYELAKYHGKQGVISRSLVARGARLVHGNELLSSVFPNYAKESPYKSREHTLGRVLAYLRSADGRVLPPYGAQSTARIRTALDFFVGYLMLDAWIGNQDRHDANWGILKMVDGGLYLSPTYDHGSSMGRNEPDERRQLRMMTRDLNQTVLAYAKRARSAFYPSVSHGSKAYSTVEAFTVAAKHAGAAADEWLERLHAVSDQKILDEISKVPSEFITAVAGDFTFELLKINRKRLLGGHD